MAESVIYMIRRKADQDMFHASFTHVRADVILTQDERQLYETEKNRFMREI